MIYTIANVTTNAGVPKQFITTRTPCNWVKVTALNSNSSADLFVGGANPSNKAGTLVLYSGNVGIRILKGTVETIPAISAVPYIDMSTLWFDVGTNGDGISVTYAVR